MDIINTLNEFIYHEIHFTYHFWQRENNISQPLYFVDVVYIGTIHPQHLSTGKLFINAQKNVLIEKPLGMNLRQVQELITAARENNVFLMEVTNGFYLEF